MCTVFTNQQTKPSARNPSKGNRSGGACVPARTSAQRRFHAKNTRIVCGGMNDGCALVGRHGRAHRRRPYPSPSYFSTQFHTNKITIYAQSTQTTLTVPHAICPNAIRHSHAIHPNEMRRGGAYVLARTSAQRRFHTKNTRIMRKDK